MFFKSMVSAATSVAVVASLVTSPAYAVETTEDNPPVSQPGDMDTTVPKPGDTKPGDTKPGDTKPDDTKPGDTKPGDTEPGDTEPGDPNPGDTKPGDTKPDDTKTGDTNPGDTKPGDTKPGDTKPDNPTPDIPTGPAIAVKYKAGSASVDFDLNANGDVTKFLTDLGHTNTRYRLHVDEGTGIEVAQKVHVTVDGRVIVTDRKAPVGQVLSFTVAATDAVTSKVYAKFPVTVTFVKNDTTTPDAPTPNPARDAGAAFGIIAGILVVLAGMVQFLVPGGWPRVVSFFMGR